MLLAGGLRLHRESNGRVRVPYHSSFALDSWSIMASGRSNGWPRVARAETIIARGSYVAGMPCNYLVQLVRKADGNFDWRFGHVKPAEGIDDNLVLDTQIVPPSNGQIATLIGVPYWWIFCCTWNHTTSRLNVYFTYRETAGRMNKRQITPFYVASGLQSRYNSPGSAVAGTGGSSKTALAVDDITLGCDLDASGNPQNCYDGALTEVALWSTVKTQSDFEGLMDERLSGSEAGLVGYWRADEGTGSTVYDRAATTGHNGTIYGGDGAAAWTDAPLDLGYPVNALAPYGMLGIASHTRRPGTTITASSEDSTYPASDLRSPIQGRPTRTTVDSVCRWVLDFGEPVPVWAVTAYNHNLTSAATLLLEGHTADSWGSPAYSAVPTYHPDRVIFQPAAPQMYRYWRFSATDAANPDTYIELGTLDFWDAYPFPVPPRMTDVRRISDLSVGTEVPQGDGVYRTLTTSEDVSFALVGLPREHEAYFRDLVRTVGQGLPVLAILWPLRALYSATIYGYARELGGAQMADPAWTHGDAPGLTITADRA